MWKFNAIGCANVKAGKGDAMYAVEKLNQATQARRFKKAETYLRLIRGFPENGQLSSVYFFFGRSSPKRNSIF